MLDRDTLLSLLGPLPEKADLSPEIIEAADCGRYIRQKVSYLVEADERVTAYVCLPKEMGKSLPAVFCHHQHASNWLLGKSEVVGLAGSPDQFYARELAERGYVTLAPDAICFEERAHEEDPKGYHLWHLHQRLVRGQTLLAKTLWDISIGIDYLTSLSQVDSRRIGFIGHSYGGRSALFAPVFDKRIKTAVSSCGCTSFQDMIHEGLGIQFDFVVPGLLKRGDLKDVVRLIEPANLLIMGADQDKWSLGLDELYKAAKSAFIKGELSAHLYPGSHYFNSDMHREAYSFLERHLKSPAG